MRLFLCAAGGYGLSMGKYKPLIVLVIYGLGVQMLQLRPMLCIFKLALLVQI